MKTKIIHHLETGRTEKRYYLFGWLVLTINK
nr:MAG TPA: hypothetical protein [Caudoviricetes sp.]